MKMMIRWLLRTLRTRLFGHDPLKTAAEWATSHTVLYPCEWAENEGLQLSHVCKFCNSKTCDELSMNECWEEFFKSNPPDIFWSGLE